jgi:queuine tRNA-ribosyltransferase
MEDSVARTTRWLERCKNYLSEKENAPLLFGINQGGVYEDIRVEHAKRIAEMDLPGYAIGGLAVGETHGQMYDIIESVVPHLPKDRPTYLMGVGTPENILEAVDRGVDFFDCVMPARNGRHAHVYTHHGKINLLNARYERDDSPIDGECRCQVCRTFSRAYLRHLFKAKEMLGMRLCVMHNLYYYNHLMSDIREALDEGRFGVFKRETLSKLSGTNFS